MALLRLSVALVAWLTLLFDQARSADITLVSYEYSKNNPLPLIRLVGIIAPGDIARLETALSESRFGRPPDITATQAIVSLNSEGGSFAVGRELAEYFRTNAIGTVVEQGNSCISACAVAFLGGRGFWPTGGIGFYKLRVVEPGATVGFHAPFFPALTVQPGMVGKLLQESRLTIAELVQTLETNDVHPRVMHRVVQMGPEERLTIDTIADLLTFRLNLPSFPEKSINRSEQEKLLNACLNLLSIEYDQPPHDLVEFVDTSLGEMAGGAKDGRRWTGFGFDDYPWGISFCGKALRDSNGKRVDAAGRSIELLSGSPDVSGIEVERRAWLAHEDKGWSFVSGTKSFRSISPLHYWFLPSETKLFDLTKQAIGAAIAKEKWFSADALKLLTIGALATRPASYADTRHRVTRIEPFVVYQHAGTVELYDHFKVEFDDARDGITYKKSFKDALVLAGRRSDPDSVFYFLALRDGANAAIIRIEHALGQREQTDIERRLTAEIACTAKLGPTKLPCSGPIRTK